jgi:6-phosphogluconolactonase/glucosamine-6-phosphate isomerase/deaminase
VIGEAARDATTQRGGFSVALSGGNSPLRMFELLGKQDVEWNRGEVFQVDERIAPDGDPDRNLTHMLEHLPPAVAERLRPMPVTGADLEAAAARYEDALPEHVDVVHLGLGPDGHTASLVPGDPVLGVDDRRIALTGGEYQGRRRMTMTYPALAGARRVAWLVDAGKEEMVEKLLARDPSIPAGRVDVPDASVITVGLG